MSDAVRPPRIRAKVTNDSVDHVHNDLANAAFYLRERVNAALNGDERRDGVFLDMMAAAAMIAFTFEGYMNFLGERVIKDWDEWQSPVEKVKAIRKALAMDVDWNKRPYATVKQIVELRKLLAHPRSHRAQPREFEAVGTDSELRKMLREYKPPYEMMITQAFINIAYEDVEAIWHDMLKVAKIDVHETWSGGTQGFEYIEHVTSDDDGGVRR
jgi:hypothetical protein